MRNKELKDVRSKLLADLHKKLKEEREKLQRLNFDLAIGKVANVREVRLTKKNISQILTIIKEKETNNK